MKETKVYVRHDKDTKGSECFAYGEGWVFWDGKDAGWQPVIGASHYRFDVPTIEDIFSSLRHTSFSDDATIEVVGPDSLFDPKR